MGRGKEGENANFFCENKLSLAISCVYKKNNSSCFFLFSFVFVSGQSSQEKTTFPRPPSARPPEILLFPSSTPKFHSVFSLSCLVAWILAQRPTNACKNCPDRFNLCKATGLSPSPNLGMANSLKLTLAKLGFQVCWPNLLNPQKINPKPAHPKDLNHQGEGANNNHLRHLF